MGDYEIKGVIDRCQIPPKVNVLDPIRNALGDLLPGECLEVEIKKEWVGEGISDIILPSFTDRAFTIDQRVKDGVETLYITREK